MNQPRIAGIIIARMDSHRLPGKVLANLGGQPLLEWIRVRASAARGVEEIAVATTDRRIDDPIAAYANAAGMKVHRGECHDVVARVLGCAQAIGAEWFFRLNGDSPFPDPNLLTEALDRLKEAACGADLLSNLGERHFPYGIAVELLRSEALASSAAEKADIARREHLTKGIYCNPERFKIMHLSQANNHLKLARLVVDTAEDLDRLRQVVAMLGPSAWSAGWRILAEAYLQRWPAQEMTTQSPRLLP
jgi:spore coat polysaccharide biosynthesis protein SpsF (cytidylyltransferase family)